MNWPLVLALAVAVPSAAAPRSFGARCKESCRKHVKDPRLMATVCGRCFVDSSGDRGGWAYSLAEEKPLPAVALESAATDPDWAVRFGACRAMAKAHGVDVARELAGRVGDGAGDASLVACLTAARGGASRKLKLADFFALGGKLGEAAAARCEKRQVELRRAIELEVYSEERELQAEALGALAVFLGVPPAKAAFGAMASRGIATDPIAAAALAEVCERADVPVGLALMRAAGEGDEPLVNRLLAVYAGQIDALRPKLQAAAPTARREAVAQLSRLGPLGARELEGALADADASVRLAAAKGLARGEGKTVAEAVKARLAPQTPLASQLSWIEFVGRAAEPGCAAVLFGAAADERLDEQVRGAAYAALGVCDGAKALPRIRRALTSPSARIRAGAVFALGAMPRVSEAERAAAEALSDESPEVLAAAARTVSAQRQRGKASALAGLLTHPAPMVRTAAAEGLGVLGEAESAKGLSERLAGDPEVEVRAAAARALGLVGGPFGISALTAAAAGDKDGRVRFLANESLRRLGFRR